MQLKDMNRQIEENRIKPAYLLYGREVYIIEEIIHKLKSTLIKDFAEFNMAILDGSETSLSKIKEACETLPFMDQRRLVLVKETELLKGKRKIFSEEQEAELIEYLASIPQTTVLVFSVHGDIDGRRKLAKAFTKLGTSLDCDKLRGNELISWAKAQFESRNMIISISDIVYFLKLSDYESKNSQKTLQDIENEMMKICSYISPGNEVTKASIEKLAAVSLENDIFKLIDCIGKKQAAEAIKIFDEMTVQGTSAMMVLSMIARQLRLMLQTRELKEAGYSPKQIAQKLEIHPFVAGKALSEGTAFSGNQVSRAIDECAQTDLNIKSGLIGERMGIEILIAELCLKK
ncbi:DNA-directed DNA polymerase III delta subunit [Peptoclostridium acidaminophilum DSM 3953]|uniref:DNA polymerase III subunit delta n=1 Tax=Peptoclostridium acidaminophilum DSM 3953 TaxID=1286171 RepID=W8TFZ2_PEPAC|nr:DNA polymerase III subunit delta [Peptoclostridium acidaminophilum]AHM56743.1 DNA-directed DNA polymerase III delta subunit [Peptoclostridium acidaminophilum DSM 3953]